MMFRGCSRPFASLSKVAKNAKKGKNQFTGIKGMHGIKNLLFEGSGLKSLLSPESLFV
jgi:hypothetical protein